MNIELQSLAIPDPSADAPAHAPLLMRMLDEIDHGMLLVTVQGRLRHANHRALGEVLRGGPLGLVAGALHAHLPADQHTLRAALADASHGRRRLLTLGQAGSTPVSVAVLPMPGVPGHGDEVGEPLALLVFGKRHGCEALTVDFYARTQGLTGAEARVLQGLCEGQRPKAIATAQGVAISTVRTHIASIRQKTRSGSIGDLVKRVMALPPITSAIKATGWHLPASTPPQAAGQPTSAAARCLQAA